MTAIPLDALEAFPQPETHVSRAARAARERENAKERARRWREDQRAAAAVDEAVILGLAVAFLPEGVDTHDGEIPMRGDAVTLQKVLTHVARAYRNGGGDFEVGKRLAGERLQVAGQEILRRRRARVS
ncbi:hypothetical protein [Methylobacterium sp. WCS2018Hpa-22]|uniref:hypothetical protein n=1 Tax=Methylobacterium sp. WCS2018Hpa-22 TaxID=3073633 RepID=UPI002889884E|nr:hypothetical protein [Methylobacterium sp. WCS2018Hpa-22]